MHRSRPCGADGRRTDCHVRKVAAAQHCSSRGVRAVGGACTERLRERVEQNRG